MISYGGTMILEPDRVVPHLTCSRHVNDYVLRPRLREGARSGHPGQHFDPFRAGAHSGVDAAGVELVTNTLRPRRAGCYRHLSLDPMISPVGSTPNRPMAVPHSPLGVVAVEDAPVPLTASVDVIALSGARI